MQNITMMVTGVALILASLQAYLSWSARDDHIESIVAGRVLDTCAEIGSVSADFLTRAEAANTVLGTDTFNDLQTAVRDVTRAYYKSTYLLDETYAQDLLLMRDLAQRSVGAVAERERDRVASLLAEFDEAGKRIQEGCRAELESSRFAP